MQTPVTMPPNMEGGHASVKLGRSHAKQPQLYIYDLEAILALPRPSIRLSRPDDYSSKWEPLRRFAAPVAA